MNDESHKIQRLCSDVVKELEEVHDITKVNKQLLYDLLKAILNYTR